MGLKKRVYHVKTELAKRLQRQRRHYFATGLCGTMRAPPAVNHTKHKTSRRAVFVDEREYK